MSHMVGMPVIPFLNMMTHPVNYAISLFILTTIVLILGKDIIKYGYKNLIHKTPNIIFSSKGSTGSKCKHFSWLTAFVNIKKIPL